MNRELATGLLVVAIAFFVGIATGKASVEPTVAVTRTVTPQACIDALEIDRQLFLGILETADSEGWVSGRNEVNRQLGERKQLTIECQGGIEL